MDSASIQKIFHKYNLVGEIVGNSPEDVFTASNCGHEEQITRYAPMRSLSVGDIILDNVTGVYHLCIPCGWEIVKPTAEGSTLEDAGIYVHDFATQGFFSMGGVR